MKKGEINAIYKVLLKSVPLKTRTKNINKATAVIKQYINTAPVRRRRNNAHKKDKQFVSTIDAANRVIKSGHDRDPKDSGKEDELNGLINQKNLLNNEVKRLKYDNIQITNLPADDNERLVLMFNDPSFQLSKTPKEQLNLATRFNLVDKFLEFHNVKAMNVKKPQNVPSNFQSLSDDAEQYSQPFNDPEYLSSSSSSS